MNLYHKTSDNKTDAPNKYCLYIGRWQPWHDGHQWLINQSLNEGKNVCVAIRDVPVDDKNPWPASEIEMALKLRFLKEIENGSIKVIIIPDIESVNFGRGVGYDIIEHLPPANVADISATKIREQMKDENGVIDGREKYETEIKAFLFEVKQCLSKYSPDELNLCSEAINDNFSKTYDHNGTLISKDWKNSFEIFNYILAKVNFYLFSIQDEMGFPIGRAFVLNYMNAKMDDSTGKGIAHWLIKNINNKY
jgi:nicotinamide mononucleotide adenylyltransferase